MDTENQKCVMVVDEHLPLGILANTAAIMGITLGKKFPESVGVDIFDKSGKSHLGIIEIPVPILKADKEKIKSLRKRLYEPEFSNVVTVDFSDVAQSCNTYDEFMKKAAQVEEDDLHYLGIALCGAKKLVNKLTGSMPLLR